MRIKDAEMGGEVLSTASLDAQDRRMARMRERRIVGSASEYDLACENPEAAKLNDQPAYYKD